MSPSSSRRWRNVMFVYKQGLERLQEVLQRGYEENMATYERFVMIEALRSWMLLKGNTTSRQLQVLDLALNEPEFLSVGAAVVLLDGKKYQVRGTIEIEEVQDGRAGEPEIAHGPIEPATMTKYDLLTYVVDAEVSRRVFMEFKAPLGASLVRIGQIAAHLFRHGAYAESPDDDVVTNWRIDEIRKGDEDVSVNPKGAEWIKAGDEWLDG